LKLDHEDLNLNKKLHEEQSINKVKQVNSNILISQEDQGGHQMQKRVMAVIEESDEDDDQNEEEEQLNSIRFKSHITKGDMYKFIKYAPKG